MTRCNFCGGNILQTEVIGARSRIETVEQCILCGREAHRAEFTPLPRVAGVCCESRNGGRGGRTMNDRPEKSARMARERLRLRNQVVSIIIARPGLRRPDLARELGYSERQTTTILADLRANPPTVTIAARIVRRSGYRLDPTEVAR